MIDRLFNRPGPARKQRAKLYVRYRALRRRFGKPVRDYLEGATGKDAAWWVEFIQQAIADSFEHNPRDPDHPFCEPSEWAHRLVLELDGRRPDRYGDENMWMAATLAIAAGTWVCRIQRAKACDPHRPVALRRAAYEQYMTLVYAMARIGADESRDPEMFPGQPWESPYLPDATDGAFV